MDKSVAELNVEHYRKLLLTDLDAVKRKTVKELLTAKKQRSLGSIPNGRSRKHRSGGNKR